MLFGVNCMPSVEVNGVRINYLQFPANQGTAPKTSSWCTVWPRALLSGTSAMRPCLQSAIALRCSICAGTGGQASRKAATPQGTWPWISSSFLDRLGIERAHFAAHSFGGAVALNLACRNPGRFASLMLLDTHISRRSARAGERGMEIRRKDPAYSGSERTEDRCQRPLFRLQAVDRSGPVETRGARQSARSWKIWSVRSWEKQLSARQACG